MKRYSPLTIEEAAEIARAHGLEQIVLWSFRESEGQHVTTWGEPGSPSELAAIAGNHVKRAAGWPEDLCRSLPSSFVAIFLEAEKTIAARIRNGEVRKGDVLSTLMALRDAMRKRDPELAEKLVPAACEEASARSEWIPWSAENDPENGHKVLIWTRWKAPLIASRHWEQGANPECWRCDDGGHRLELRDVTHWMPFPEGPR